MTEKAIQEFYADAVSYCYGCGTLNPHGLQIKSYQKGDETICHFMPRDYHTAIPGYVYGGLLASLIDCHGTSTAAAAAYRAEGRAMDTSPRIRFVTASLQVDFLRPTPLGVMLELRGRVEEISDRKVVVAVTLSAEEQLCVQGKVVAVRAPKTMIP